MPISLLPDDRRLFWLKCDKDTPLEQRAVFVCNSPTRETMLRWSQLYDEAVAISKGPEAFAKLHEMIKLGVKSMRNCGDGSLESVVAMENWLTGDEIQELAFGWPEAFKMTEEERVNFSSAPASDAAPSVIDVTAAA